jgi:hypothetical protein
MTDPLPGLERLRRWEDAGGHWRVLVRASSRVVVALERCDGGEEVDRFESAEPEVLDYLAGRTTP